MGPKPQSAVTLLSKYSNKPSEIGKLNKPTVATIKANSSKKRKFFIRGLVQIDRTYVSTRRGKESSKTYKNHLQETFPATIEASNRQEAIEMFKLEASNKLNSDGYDKKNQVASVQIE